MRSLTKFVVGAIVVPLGLLTACSADRSAEGTANAPDVSANAPKTETPLDRGGSEADRNATQLVRKGITDQDQFSVNAKSVKVVTKDGVVTLRGPVDTTAEKIEIEAITAKANGVKRVDNQLEVQTR
jgi:osmotically-inducible protein OsmY